MDVVGYSIALLIVAILVGLIARRFKLPYSVGLVVAGVGLALLHVHIGIDFTPEFIFSVLLPPLLFEGALNISWEELRRDMSLVLSLAVLGVFISALLTCLGMVYLLGWPWQVAAVFGALIAATDPVSVIALFKNMHIDGRVPFLLKTESLFNDGVAAVLFAVALTFASTSFREVHFAGILFQFLFLVAGGLLVGILCGTVGIIATYRTDDHLLEAAITTVIAYGSFLVAGLLGVSGVLATVTAGLWIGNIGFRDGVGAFFTERGRVFVVEFWEFVAFLADSVMFILIGLRVATIPLASFGWYTLFVAIGLVFLSRAFAVYPIAWLFLKTRWAIPISGQHVLWWGGLRGGLALALALSLPAHIPMHDEIMGVTFAVVIFSVLVQGLSMPFLVKKSHLED